MTKFYKINDIGLDGYPITFFFKHDDNGLWIKSHLDYSWLYYNIELIKTENYQDVTTEEYNELILEEI